MLCSADRAKNSENEVPVQQHRSSSFSDHAGTTRSNHSQRSLISQHGSLLALGREKECAGSGGDGDAAWKCDGSSNGQKETKHGDKCKVECLGKDKGYKPVAEKVECDNGAYKAPIQCSGAQGNFLIVSFACILLLLR